jgi:hypothetical protein
MNRIYSYIEGIVAVMVGCVPSLREFWNIFISKEANGSQKSTNLTYPCSSSENSLDPPRAYWEGNSEYINA